MRKSFNPCIFLTLGRIEALFSYPVFIGLHGNIRTIICTNLYKLFVKEVIRVERVAE